MSRSAGTTNMADGQQCYTVALGIILLFVLTHGYEDKICEASCRNHECGLLSSYAEGACFCDEACIFHGDCCMDYLDHCTNSSQQLSKDDYMTRLWNSSRQSYMTCVQFQGYNHLFRMITKCPDDSEDEDTVAKCENPSATDLPSRVPVFDEASVYTFRNKFCAECHGFQQTIVQTPHFICSNSTEAFLVQRHHGFHAFLDYVMVNCTLAFAWTHTDAEAHFARRTCPKLDLRIRVNECKEGTVNSSIYCESYAALAQGFVGGKWYIFKNEHCARCNDFTAPLMCDDSPPGYTKDPLDGVSSFSLLMDFSSEDGVREHINFNNHPLCGGGQYLDIINNICVNKSCKASEIFHEGQCITVNVQQQSVNMDNQTIYVFLKIKLGTRAFKFAQLERYLPVEQFNSEIVNMSYLNCTHNVFDTIASNGNRNESKVVCLQVEFQSLKEIFMWDKVVSLDVWKDFVLRLRDYVSITVQEFVVMSSHTSDSGCRSGSFKWQDEFTLITDDDLGFTTENSLSLLIPSSGVVYPLTSVADFLMYKDFDLHAADTLVTKFAVCELAVFMCDKIAVDDGRYDVTNINDTHAHLEILVMGGPSMELDADRSEFAITNESLLVVCTDILLSSADGSSEMRDLEDTIQTYMTVIGLSASMFCLLITFVIHCIFPGLQTIAGKLLMNISLSLLLAQLLFLISGVWSSEYIVCKVLAVCQHYLWLVSFCWMNVFAVDVSMTFVKMKRGFTASSQTKPIVGYAFYAWGVPACLCITAVCIDVLTDLPFTYGWETVAAASCWISPGQALLYSFGVPIGLILLINAVCFVVTLVVFVQTRKETEKATSSESNAQTVLISVKLSTVMGFTWLFGFLANIKSLWFLVYLFIIFNTLQGVILIVSFICTQRVRRLMKHFIRTGERVISSTTVNTSSRSKSTTKPNILQPSSIENSHID